jgi:hypothetical protein
MICSLTNGVEFSSRMERRPRRQFIRCDAHALSWFSRYLNSIRHLVLHFISHERFASLKLESPDRSPNGLTDNDREY